MVSTRLYCDSSLTTRGVVPQKYNLKWTSERVSFTLKDGDYDLTEARVDVD